MKLRRGRRFLNITGQNDKGKAVRLLKKLYRTAMGEITAIGIGDSFNDLPMFEEVDMPVLVQKAVNRWESMTSDCSILKVKGVGPAGWNRFVLDLLSR